MSRVQLKNVSKRFGPVVAVENISCTADDGELFVLVGPSGCGKTTILRLIAGLENPDAGDILFDQQSVLTLPPERRGAGLVFQNYALFPHMTVEKNVAYGLRFTEPRPNRRERVRELLELVGLAGLEGRMPAELSAGQQQRVALARALAPHPKILLLDEPLSALDAKLRERLRAEIKKIQQALKITTIYVTHDQEEALVIADRIAVLKSARLEQVGTPVEVYQTPQTEFVARFIGRGNLMEARVITQKNTRVLLEIEGNRIWAQCAAPLTDTVVRVLIRPERICVQSATENELRGRVAGLEFMGDCVWVHLQTGKTSWVAQADLRAALQEGERVAFGFNAEDVYILPQSVL